MDIDFSKIKHKKPKNYMYDYDKFLIEDRSDEFFVKYKELIYEENFYDLFLYHTEKFKSDFLQRIKKMYPKFGNKRKEIGYLLECILLEGIAEKDFKNHLKNHLEAFIFSYDKTVDELKEEIAREKTENLYKNDFINFKARYLSKMMRDCLEILQWLEEINGIKSNYNVGVGRLIYGKEVFWYANSLMNGANDCSNRAYYLNLAFLIRGSIELRIKNGLGINSIFGENGSTLKIASDSFIDFICENDQITIPREIKKSLLKKIFTWCNYHIHGGIILYAWQFTLIFEYLRPLFMGDEVATETRRQMSIYGAIKMKEEYFKNHLASDLKNYLNNRKGKNEISSIKLFKSPEAMLIKE